MPLIDDLLAERLRMLDTLGECNAIKAAIRQWNDEHPPSDTDSRLIKEERHERNTRHRQLSGKSFNIQTRLTELKAEIAKEKARLYEAANAARRAERERLAQEQAV